MARRDDVTVNIGGDNKGAQAALDATAKGIKRFSDESKKLFGGLGGQVFSLRGALASLVGAVSVKSIITATIESERATRQLEATLKSTAGAAGLTKAELLDMADGLQQVTAFEDDAIVSTEALLLKFQNVHKDVFPRALTAILDVSAALDKDLSEASTQVGKALNDPVKGISQLEKVGVAFTAGQEKAIKALVETGRVAEAQTIILGELEKAYGGSAVAARDTLGGALDSLKNAFGNLLEGDAGNVNDAKAAVEELTKTLNDPAVKQGFATLVGGTITLTATITKAASEIAGLAKFLGEEFAARTVGPALDDIVRIEDALARVNKEITFLQNQESSLLFGSNKARIDKLKAEAADLQRKLKAAQDLAAQPQPKAEPVPTSGKPGAGPAGVTPLTKAEVEARLKAAAAASQAIFQAELARAEAELEDSLKRRLITVEQYYQAKQDLELGAIDAEIEALQKERARANAAEQIQIDGQIEALRIKRVAAAQQLARDEVAAYADERKTQLDLVQKDIADVLAAFDRAQGSATTGVQTGALSPDAAQSLVRDNAAKALEALQLLRPQMQALAQQGVPGAAEAFDALNASIDGLVQKTQGPLATALQNLRLEWANVQQSFAQDTTDALRNSIAGFFTDLVSGAKSAGEAARDFALSFVNAMADVAARALATYATLQLVKAAGVAVGVAHGGGFAGETGKSRVIPAFAFAGAPRLHDGGVLGLRPGEVPTILERGEEVLAKNDPRNARNGGAAPAGGGGMRIINVIDPSLVQDYLSSSSGERTILNVIERNRGAIKQTLF